MLREKQFYKTFSVLALSLALHNLLSYSVNMMDMVMLGRYSQNAMSGVSLCNQVQFMLQMLVEGAGEGAVVLGAQYWGKNRLEPIPHIIGAAMRFGGGMAVIMFLIVRLVPEQLLNLLSNDPLVIAEGVRYFQIVSWTYILFTVTNILVGIPAVCGDRFHRICDLFFYLVYQYLLELPADLRQLRFPGAGCTGCRRGHVGLPLY